MNILFVCSRNKWRSKTAESIFKSSQKHDVKSAGTSKTARIKLTETLLIWADIIFVMEEKHQQIIEKNFTQRSFSEKIVVLDIADEYQYMDEELVFILKLSVSNVVENL